MRAPRPLVVALCLAVATAAAAQDPAPAPPAPPPAEPVKPPAPQPRPAAKPAAPPAAAPGDGTPAAPVPPAPAAPGEAAPPEREGRTYVYLRSVVRSEGKVSHLYRVGHKRGAQLQALLNALLPLHGIKDVLFTWQEEFHLFVVTGPEKSVEFVRTLLETLDRPEPQVRIEAVIAEVETGTGFQSGVDSTWDRKTSDRTFFRGYDVEFNPDDFLNASTARPFQGAAGTFSTTGSTATRAQFGDLTLMLRAVAEQSRVEVLARPYALVLNGRKAVLSSGFEILAPQSVSVSVGVPTTTLVFKPVSTVLTVTPHVLGDRTIQLEVEVTANEIVREEPVDRIKISTRSVKTEAILNEREYLELGGLKRSRTVVEERGIPLLMDIPLLGYLFKSYGRAQTDAELRIFIIATIEDPDRPESRGGITMPTIRPR